MTEVKAKKHHHSFPIYIVKRDDMSGKKAFLIRVVAVLIGILLAGVLFSLLTGNSFADGYSDMFKGAFGGVLNGSFKSVWSFLRDTAILLALSLAVTPAFKMKFWNCGAEGQALIGALVTMIIANEFGKVLPAPVLMVIIVVSGIVAGAIWGLVPAIFKANFNTNETLFTLMMNYVATQIAAFYICAATKGKTILTLPGQGTVGALPVLGLDFLLIFLVVMSIMVMLFFYMKYSKHGYEISVVGESQNTARYVGINVKKVVLRTMIISGAICGLTGMLLVSGIDHSITVDIIEGRGFTAIMVSWLGMFNPFLMAAISALIVFLDRGTGHMADMAMMSKDYAEIVTGVVILLLVGCEFFTRYSIKIRRNGKEEEA